MIVSNNHNTNNNKKDGSVHAARFQELKSCTFGDFKGLSNTPVTLGSITNVYDEDVPVFIVGGIPSMIL